MKLFLSVLALVLLLAQPAFAVEYHGNPESKNFHHPTCRHYSAASSTEKFSSTDEAMKAGYKPCRVCFVDRDGKVESKAAVHARETGDKKGEKKGHRKANRGGKQDHKNGKQKND